MTFRITSQNSVDTMANVTINGDAHAPHELQDLAILLDTKIHRFLQPTSQDQQTAIAAAKALLDPLATEISQAQTLRRNDNRRKRKRGTDEVEDPVLQLKQVYTTGLGVKQVWEQARRILDAACSETERAIDLYLPEASEEDLAQDESLSEFTDEEVVSDEDLSDMEAVDLADDLDDDSMGEDDQLDNEIDEEEDIEDESDVIPSDAEELDNSPHATYKQDPNKLNDGFFSIDDFNKQSQFLEQIDARGDDDNLSDEDEIDWDADPMSITAGGTKAKKEKLDRQTKDADEDESSEDDENGPTFGNADLAGIQEDSEDEGEDVDGGELDGAMSGLVNTNDVRYADFFEPPPKKPSKSKRTRALPKTQPPAELSPDKKQTEEAESDIERAIADVRRDLLDSEEELSEEEDDQSDMSDDSDALPRLSASKLKNKNLSTHEKQRLQIAEEIRRLENINVSKKPWALSGEASASARPLNSLIEEDLEFERTGKPVPVITAEVSNDIEALIKRRILARDFDEVVRRRPTTLDSAADTRRGRADAVVDDSKPTTSLGEIYESEFQRNADPTSYVDKRSAATKKQHEEIDRLWKEVRDQLDVLGNLHFKPKRAEVEIKTVEDKPLIAMEDARPAISGSGIDDGNSTLAPQEIYKPGTDSRAEKGEVLNSKSGTSRSKEEMTREEKTRKRRRDKERQKKASGSPQAQKMANGAKSQGKAGRGEVLKDLQKGRVKIIGKGGRVEEISEKAKKGRGDERVLPTSGGALKL